MTRELSFFSFPTKIWFGAGAVTKLADIYREQNYGKALVITDAGFSRTRAFEKVHTLLKNVGIDFALFNEVSANPAEDDVLRGVGIYKERNCEWILGIGGGSPLDVAKAVRLMTTHSGRLFDYDDAQGGSARITADLPPFIAVPTTAGTGSEVGRSTVITDNATKTKRVIFSPYLLATQVLADPELTLELPPAVTAATGMDALTHNIESYLAKGYHPIADGVALQGIRLIAKSLKRAVTNPGDLAARSDMLMASMMGAIAFQKGLGVTHSLAHPLSTLAGLHHGLANAVMLVPAMRFNSDVGADRLSDIAQVVNAETGRKGVASAQSAIDYFEELCLGIGIPRSLNAVGVGPGLVSALAEQALQDGCHMSNPKPVLLRDFEQLYNEAL